MNWEEDFSKLFSLVEGVCEASLDQQQFASAMIAWYKAREKAPDIVLFRFFWRADPDKGIYFLGFKEDLEFNVKLQSQQLPTPKKGGWAICSVLYAERGTIAMR